MTQPKGAILIETLAAGGPVMVPIALCSVVAFATFLERLWSTRRGRVVPSAMCRELVSLVQNGKVEEAKVVASRQGGPMSRVADAALSNATEPRALLKERVQEVGRREAADLERFVPVLGTIASIAPLLGLLGTVGGMIMTFQVIAEQGVGEVDSLAGGISQALITTFAGLVVGIPALVANRFILARVDRLLLDMEEVSIAIVDALAGAE